MALKFSFKTVSPITSREIKNMKRLLIASAFILLASAVHAIDIDFTASGNKPSITQSTIALSSMTATTIAATGHFEVWMSSTVSRYFYRLDASTLNMTTSGMPVAGGTHEKKITAFNELHFLLPPNVTAETVPYIMVKPN